MCKAVPLCANVGVMLGPNGHFGTNARTSKMVDGTADTHCSVVGLGITPMNQ